MQIYLEDYMSELTNIENGKVKLSLKIPAEDYRRALESAYRRTGAHYNIPGFRKGKVPRRVIEATYGVNVFWDEEFDFTRSKRLFRCACRTQSRARDSAEH